MNVTILLFSALSVFFADYGACTKDHIQSIEVRIQPYNSRVLRSMVAAFARQNNLPLPKDETCWSMTLWCAQYWPDFPQRAAPQSSNSKQTARDHAAIRQLVAQNANLWGTVTQQIGNVPTAILTTAVNHLVRTRGLPIPTRIEKRQGRTGLMCWLCEHWSTVKDDVNEAIKQATKQIRQASGQPRDKIIQQQVLDYANEVAVREREQVMPPNSNNIAPPPPIIALQQMAPDTSDVPLILSFTGTFGGNLRNDQWSSFSIDGHRAPQ